MMKDENLENTVATLYVKGWTIRRLSREFGISRGRVRRLLVSNSILLDTTPKVLVWPKSRRPSKLDPYKEFIGELLDKYSDITGQRVYEYLKEKGFDGEITIVRDYLKSIRQVVSKTPVKLVETDSGQRAAHDWSDYQIPFTSTGQTEKVTFFSYILCYSRWQYIGVVNDKTQNTLFRELIGAFIYLEGVPREIKSDNQKACVDRWEMGQPVFNRKYFDLAISDVVSRLEGFAPEMSEYIEQVNRHKPNSWGHHLRRLLALKVNYRVDDILLAVSRAHQYKVYDAGTIERFMENNSEPRYSVKLSFKPKNKNDYEH